MSKKMVGVGSWLVLVADGGEVKLANHESSATAQERG
jgi:hypothetical protein